MGGLKVSLPMVGMLMMPTISNFISYADLVPGISIRVGDATSIPKVLREEE
jgi:hypothetical protein